MRRADVTTAGGAFLPVAFNVAIFFAGIVGAALLTVADGLVLPVLMIGFGVVAFALTVYGRRNAFPAGL